MGLAINYHLCKHTLITSEATNRAEPAYRQCQLNNYIFARGLLALSRLSCTQKCSKILFRRIRAIINLIVLNSLVVVFCVFCFGCCCRCFVCTSLLDVCFLGSIFCLGCGLGFVWLLLWLWMRFFQHGCSMWPTGCSNKT